MLLCTVFLHLILVVNCVVDKCVTCSATYHNVLIDMEKRFMIAPQYIHIHGLKWLLSCS